jgi:hypothetical protein
MFMITFWTYPASAQLVTLYIDHIENAQSTDIEGRDGVYFLLIGSSSTGRPVYMVLRKGQWDAAINQAAENRLRETIE